MVLLRRIITNEIRYEIGFYSILTHASPGNDGFTGLCNKPALTSGRAGFIPEVGDIVTTNIKRLVLLKHKVLIPTTF